jgi:uncharacterized protein
LNREQFDKIENRLKSEKVEFVIKPQKRYEGKVGEQMTMFIFDFSGNSLEFKSFTNTIEVFSK